MANHDDQFQEETTPVAEAAPKPTVNITALHTPQSFDAELKNPLDNEWDNDKTEVLTESLDSNVLSAWLTDSNGDSVEMTHFPFIVGRGKDCDLIPEGQGLSRRHAEIIFHSGRFVVRDLDSVNGIQVNDCKVARVILEDGDDISIGSTHFTFGHRNPTSQAQASPPPTEGLNKWLKTSAIVAVLLLVVTGGLSIFQKYNKSSQTMVIQRTDSDSQTRPAPPAALASKEAPKALATPEIAAAPPQTIAKTKAETETTRDKKTTLKEAPGALATPEIAAAQPEKITQVTAKTKQGTEATQTNPTKLKPPPLVIKKTTIARPSSAQQQRLKSIKAAKRLLQNADRQYLAGNPSQTIKQLRVASLSKILPAHTKREALKKYYSLNYLHSFYTTGNTALGNNNTDKTFENWGKYLTQLNVDFPDKIPVYAKEVPRFMADEYAKRAQIANDMGKYKLAYQLWQKEFSLNKNPAAQNQIALIEDKASQLYRQGLRQEYVNVAKARTFWLQASRLVPPSSGIYIKANSKLASHAPRE